MDPKLNEKLEKFLHGKEVLKELRRVTAAGQKSLVIEFEKLLESDKELAKELLDAPGGFFEAADTVLEGITKIPGMRLRVKGLDSTLEIRSIRSEHVSKFIQVEGIMTRAGEVKPEAKEAVFKCRRCGEEIRVPQVSEFFREPLACDNPNCRKKGPFDLVVESTVFRDWQSIQLQEPPEKLRGGRMPRRLDGIIRDDFVDKAVPGNHVTLTGVLRVFQERQQRERKTTFRKILFVSHIEVLHKGVEEAELTPEDEEKIKELAKDPWIGNKIIQSVAPAIHGYGTIKEAIALQLFGCNPIELDDGTRIRGDTHILMSGDPGTAKSQILKWVANVAPRGLYTSGMKATGAGLCVAPNSLIWIQNGLVPISDLVENHFGGRPVPEITALRVKAIPQFNGGEDAVTFLWKIPSPPEMIEVRTQYGKRIEVTPETKIMTERGWKKAKDLTTKDVLILPINYGGWELSYPSVVRFYPGNIRIKNRSEIFARVSSKIKDKRALANVLEIPEDKLYHRWRHDEVRGTMTLAELQKVCSHLEMDLDEVLSGVELKCQLRSGSYFKLPTRLSPELAYFIGLMAGDGSLSSKLKGRSVAVRFSNNDLGEKYAKLVRELFGKDVEVSPASDERAADFRFGNLAVFKLPRSLGIQKPEKLYIPREVTCNRELAIAYLRGLFDTDGSVYDRRCKNRKRGGIELTTVYKEFAEQIQSLLFRLGIPAYLWKRKPRTYARRDGALIKSGTQYRIFITQNASIDRFAELIGFSVSRKREKLEKIRGRKRAIKFFNQVPARIKEIRTVRPSYEYVYDVTIEGSHSFIANGFLVHNTAAAVRDEIGGGWTLEAGALVIADGGLASIDEFEKMSQEDAAAILESMEQQTISVAKAGIVATLNTRTAILAATNPKFGRFDKNIPPAQQLALDPVLLSRFDLVLIMRDEPHPDYDRSMAQHVLQMHTTPKKVVKAPFAPDFFRKIIIYARKNIDPKLDDKEAQKVIENFFVDWRKVAAGGGAPLPITVRQLEALIRLAKANARMRLSDRVTVEDANRAIGLIKTCLQDAGMDIEKGVMDIDILMTGISKSQREKHQRVLEIIKELEAQYGGAVPIEKIRSKAGAEGIRESFVDWMIEEEKKRGHLYSPTPETVSRAVK
ncbi:MAG: LAGLIDADG family homing endonuclease [Candidatus Hodarchaeaceae archaeon]|nr:LAGLIDADG family homing endonuclease [Candidatus Hodarchaeaceae archaeon]